MRKNAGMIPTEAQAFGLGLAGCDTGTGGGDTPDMPPANVSGLRGIVGNKKVMLSWTDPADADLAAIEITWTGGSSGSTSVAKGTRIAIITGLTNGTAYTFTVKAKDRAGNRSGGVISAALTPFVVAGDVAAIKAYLADVSNAFKGISAADPLPLPVSLDLANGSAWTDLLDAIQTANKYVALDLSSCTMSGTEFDPGTAAHPGKSKVVSLVLPDAATSIGGWVFYSCTSLETVNLPAATTIGNRAFSYCISLETLNLPAVPPTLGSSVFRDTASSGALTIHVPSGKVAGYTTVWGVDAETAAGGNTAKYGNVHKRIVITAP